LNINGGLGAKVPLSYTDNFWIETFTIEEGINIYRKWVQYIDSTRVGVITLLEEEINPAEFKQGTNILIPFQEKDLLKLVDSLSLYLRYTKSKYRMGEGQFNNLILTKNTYNYFGENWAFDSIPRSSYAHRVVIELSLIHI
jgi:hypothetical protein